MYFQKFVIGLLAAALVACVGTAPDIPVNFGTSEPGGTITRSGTPFRLLGTPIELGQPLPSVTLYSSSLEAVELSELKGNITIVSVVPSIDTGVCEQQTHLLGEKEGASEVISRVTISRDLPFAQQRFKDEVDFDGVLFLSDFKDGSFGMQTGLLIDKIGLLARAVLVLDREGIVRYLQVVPEVANLPDMDRAFAFAEQLVKEN